MDHPIIITGFGRSGTTWVSDILSKTLGGLVLFEPDHPRVCPQSEKFIYGSSWNAQELDELTSFLQAVMDKRIRHPWLLRNHLPSEDEVSESFQHMIWNESKVIGLKAIRWNHNLLQLHKMISRRIVYIIRHPLSVVASILRRENFFGEFGWQKHWHLFKQRNPLAEINLEEFDDKPLGLRYIAMWTISNLKAISDISQLGVSIVQYEKLYDKPYQQTKALLHSLGYTDIDIHPSHLFYPSMSTLKTVHTFEKGRSINDFKSSSFFWEDLFNTKETSMYLEQIEKMGSNYPEELAILQGMGYLEAK